MDADRHLDDLNSATRRLADLADDSDEAARLRERVDRAIERLRLCGMLLEAGVRPESVSRAEERGLLAAEDEAELREYVDDLAEHRT